MHYTSIWYIWFLLQAIKHDDFQSLGFLQHIDTTRPMIQSFEDLAKQLGHAQRWQPRFQAKHSNEPCSEHTDSDFKCCRMLHKWDFTDFLFALLLPLACTSLWFGLVTIMASPRRTAWGLMSCPCWTMTNVWFNVPGKKLSRKMRNELTKNAARQDGIKHICLLGPWSIVLSCVVQFLCKLNPQHLFLQHVFLIIP